jgi:hypothetical protein
MRLVSICMRNTNTHLEKWLLLVPSAFYFLLEMYEVRTATPPFNALIHRCLPQHQLYVRQMVLELLPTFLGVE